MYNVELEANTILYLEMYFSKYREYYQKLYEDSGLWNENQIIQGYISESQKRKQEILELIQNRIAEEKIIGRTPENTVFIKWRTKFIFVKWIENIKSKTRIITKLEIK